MQRIRFWMENMLKQKLILRGQHYLLTRIKMRKIFLVLLVSIVIAQFSTPNYQERQVYYNEDENICNHAGNEQVILDISVDGRAWKKEAISTHTYCDHWASDDADRIAVTSRWSYLDGASELRFDQDITSYSYDDKIVGIVTKTTIRSPATIDGKQYNCNINGNGEIIHYGGDGSINYHPPTISISCSTPIVSQ